MQFMRIKQVVAETCLSKATIYKLIKAGDFPAPIKISVGLSAWLTSEVAEWQQQRIQITRNSECLNMH